jgi:hypothetical protein
VRTIEKTIEKANPEEAIESPSQVPSEGSSKTLFPGAPSETPSEMLSETPSLEGEPKA